MLYRKRRKISDAASHSKKNDVNKDKWIGVGGHFEADESPEECLLREVKEETGYTLTSWKYRAIVTFVSGDGVTEYMSLFTADGFTGEQIACDEGELKWVDKKKLTDSISGKGIKYSSDSWRNRKNSFL